MVTTVNPGAAPELVPSAPRPLATIEKGMTVPQIMRALLESGVHFGHQTKRWNPKMRQYIFTERNGIHIIDLGQSVSGLEDAAAFVQELAAQGGRLLFVGTKKQAQDTVAEEAKRCGQYFANKRWPGGLLTNFVTIRQRLRYLAELEAREARGEFEQLPKREAKKLTEEKTKLNDVLGGIKNLYDLPNAIFVVDPHKERIAMLEALRLEIPVIAITDTNCNPDEIDYVIPGNDDAIRSVKIIAAYLADAYIEGSQRRAQVLQDQLMDEAAERASRHSDRKEDEEGGGGEGERQRPQRRRR
ncbi:30S ribosomal protein S2 [Candidatus Chlorohelix sp.]|uniref:30S ribosomal protein S2 n=1 Tax=Candidatus Chlorohelix sp. TaxID=3139201 RepID=UPI003144EF1D